MSDQAGFVLILVAAVVLPILAHRKGKAAPPPVQLPPPGWPEGVPFVPQRPQRSVVGTTLKVVLTVFVVLLSPFIVLALL